MKSLYFLLFFSPFLVKAQSQHPIGQLISRTDTITIEGAFYSKNSKVFYKGDSVTIRNIETRKKDDHNAVFAVSKNGVLIPLDKAAKDFMIKRGGNDGVSFTIDSLQLRNGSLYYTAIFEMPNMSADQIFSNARYAIEDMYDDSRAVIRVTDIDNHKLIGKGNFSLHIRGIDETVDHSIEVSTKEGKVKLDIYDIDPNHYSLPSAYSQGGYVHLDIKELIEKSSKKQYAYEALRRIHAYIRLLQETFYLEMMDRINQSKSEW